tara:strand:- start:260 stop:511 length:252 start_codon:yes stop_codon:yes gene_type:complete
MGAVTLTGICGHGASRSELSARRGNDFVLGNTEWWLREPVAGENDRKKMRCRKRIVSLVNMLLEKKAAEGSAWHALQPDGFVS